MSKLKLEDLIVQETDDFIFINKPPLISTLDDRAGTGTSILRLAKAYCPEAQVCHRLDKETSGILLISKHNEAYKFAAIRFEHREVKKVYHAVTDGIHDFNIMHVNLPITPLPNGIVKIDRQSGKPAETFFRTLEVYKQHTLVECLPVTGRMHQIRIHLATIGASITGDLQYGGHEPYLSSLKKKFNLKKDTEEQPMIKRFALHAKRLELEDPKGGTLSVEAPYLKDMEVLIKLLAKNK
jgi:23S rRNA pseudouridine955/2504/2580 synthase